MRVLEVAQLTKAFGGLIAVNGVDFHADANEIVGLIGPNGAGKTTLFNAITGVYAPTSGSIIFMDRDIAGMRPSKITELGVARTFQNIRLFNEMTVLENVMVGQHCRTQGSLLGVVARTRRAVQQEKAVRDRPRAAGVRGPASGAATSSPRACPTDRSDGWRSPGRWPPSPSCCSSTSRPPA